MSEQNEDQLINIGNDAEKLLNDKAFNNVIDGIVQGTFQAFVNSNPEEAEIRERNYSAYRAVVDIVNTLKQQVSIKDEIEKRNSRQTEE